MILDWKRLLVPSLALAAFLPSASGMIQPATPDITEIANVYLEHYVKGEIDELAPHLASDVIFEDTAMRLKGKADVIQGLKSVFAHITGLAMKKEHRYLSGPTRYLSQGIAHFTQKGEGIGIPGKSFEIEIPMTIVLTFRGDKVVHHIDYVDVGAYTECIRSQTQRRSGKSAERLQTTKLGAIKRVHNFGEIFLASQPGAKDFDEIKKNGIRTVINQRRPREIQDFDEREVVESLGMNYHNPGFGRPSELTDKVLDLTRELLRTAKRPVLIHCASANRTGAAWLAYRSLDEGIAWEPALQEAKMVGLRSPELEKIVKSYVERNQKGPE